MYSLHAMRSKLTQTNTICNNFNRFEAITIKFMIRIMNWDKNGLKSFLTVSQKENKFYSACQLQLMFYFSVYMYFLERVKHINK